MSQVSENAGLCVACGAPALRDWRSVRSFDRRSARAAYTLRRCERCGTAVTEGRTDDDVAGLHRGGVYERPLSRRLDRLVEPLRLLGDRASVAAVGSVDKGTRVLDLGAGDGRMLALLHRRGCIVSGVEPFATMRRADLNVRRTTLEEADVDDASADVVLLWHVLEHVDDPSRALDVAAKAVRPGGRLVVSVPTLDSLQARLGGEGWFHLDVPRHAVHFTRAGLVCLLERSGFQAVHESGVALDQNLLGMAQTLLNRLTIERNVAFRALKGDRANIPRRDVVLTAVVGVPVALSAMVAEAFAMLVSRSGAVVVHAERRAP